MKLGADHNAVAQGGVDELGHGQLAGAAKDGVGLGWRADCHVGGGDQDRPGKHHVLGPGVHDDGGGPLLDKVGNLEACRLVERTCGESYVLGTTAREALAGSMGWLCEPGGAAG